MTVPAALPLVLPVLFLIPFFFVLVPLILGLAIALAVSRFNRVDRVARSHTALIAGRVAIAVVAIALLPRTAADLHDVIVRDQGADSERATAIQVLVPGAADSEKVA